MPRKRVTRPVIVPPLVAIRVVVAEDSLLVREGLRQLLAASPSVDVVASYGDVQGVLDAVERDRPDVVVTDIRMPPRTPMKASDSRTTCVRAARRREWSS